MSSSFLEVGETRPCRVRASLKWHLNRAMMVVEESVLVRHVETKVVEVELAFMTDQLQSMVAQVRNVQHNKSTQLH